MCQQASKSASNNVPASKQEVPEGEGGIARDRETGSDDNAHIITCFKFPILTLTSASLPSEQGS